MSVSSIRPALITEVLPDSIGADVGFEPGDAIVSINGTRPRDLIDYQFLCADEFLEIEVIDSQGKTHHIELEKDYDESLGLEFETALFDGLIQCNNRCPFCFIDQQPPGKRGSLYLKDDDYRLSFLYGSYLTLTNLPQSEWDRIAQMRISPLYVSVHATEPEVRSLLLKNQRAGQILEQLKWFQKHRLQIHAQVVVCPGINDGVHLEKTLLDLAEFHRGDIPAVASVAVVPVGLTRFRPPEDQLISVSQEKAREVIKQVQNLQDKFKQELGSTCVWLADEWFLIAREELPPESDYEDYPQIGNGVGSIRKFLREFETAFERVKWETGNGVASPRRWTWVVGNAVELAFKPIVARLNGVEGLRVEMVALASDYWGQEITVTGLLTGQDLIAGLQGRDLGDGVLLPSLMLKTGDTRFLDDLTVAEVEATLQTKIVTVNGVDELLAIASNLTH
ncbi:MAG: TIGR03279 family radical SAM protein [Limnospira sp. PMC 1291.21]|uniref:FeS-containing Cyanobacterial-specific oxidoreductase n=1 Tax=Limnospira maxima CS-328 TaxID=513049 RepID=B5VYN8_LIMMA|nr:MULTISPECIES: TIGR03279 family radical SAM protein [Limnospira]MDC0839493.1 TIGR03279 family radical SAM protein [Limnoraphis robusta]MDT9182858.1 TIGR03279 family radical SAM protein [Limnospira sp. PMC 289.06]QJB26230.1 TIGR03279 family radical SAM protein [Limnospira fusiformis SAG 85.79]EDZ95658.1 FeS-containing Cyanobacterial-specific oxidoreductase [Limnospira maxima CS-328]MDT9178148.1 TIGR03279 family radical SAM protein [Limnospira sp. PMC 1238.20]